MYLKKAGLLSYPQRGTIELKDPGRKNLDDLPRAINVKFLTQFHEFVGFQTPQQNDSDNAPTGLYLLEQSGSPEEILEASF